MARTDNDTWDLASSVGATATMVALQSGMAHTASRVAGNVKARQDADRLKKTMEAIARTQLHGRVRKYGLEQVVSA